MSGAFKIKPSFSEFDLVSIVIYGAFQQRQETKDGNASVQFTEDFDVQLMRLLNRKKKEIPLIGEYCHFDEQGAFPYSREISGTLTEMAAYNLLTRITGEPGRIARPIIGKFVRMTLEERTISEEDYQKLFNLGKELPIKRVVYI